MNLFNIATQEVLVALLRDNFLFNTVEEGVPGPPESDGGGVPRTGGRLLLGRGELPRGSGSNWVSRFDWSNVGVGASGLRVHRVYSTLLNVVVYGLAFSSALCLELFRSKMSGIEVWDVASCHALWLWGRLRAAKKEWTLDYLPVLELPVALDDATVQEGDEDLGRKSVKPLEHY
jgi:hypothetical protein